MRDKNLNPLIFFINFISGIILLQARNHLGKGQSTAEEIHGTHVFSENIDLQFSRIIAVTVAHFNRTYSALRKKRDIWKYSRSACRYSKSPSPV